MISKFHTSTYCLKSLITIKLCDSCYMKQIAFLFHPSSFNLIRTMFKCVLAVLADVNIKSSFSRFHDLLVEKLFAIKKVFLSYLHYNRKQGEIKFLYLPSGFEKNHQIFARIYLTVVILNNNLSKVMCLHVYINMVIEI